jgi:putative inorganic carbon (hco3(-)) transporter
MSEHSSLPGWRTADRLRLTGAALTLVIVLVPSISLVAGEIRLQAVMVVAITAALTGLLILLRPREFGVPLLVVLLFANASDLLTRLYSIPSVLQLVFIAMVGSLWIWRDELRPRSILLHPLSLALAAWGLVVFMSSAWASDPSAADQRFNEIVRSFLLFFIVGTFASSSWKALRGGAVALVLTAGALASLSLYQVATGRYDQQFGRFAAVQFGHIYEQVSDARIAGPIGDPNFYAQVLLLAIPPGLALTTITRRTGLRVALGAATFAALVAMLFTYSRGAMLAIAVMICLLPFAVPSRSRLVAGAFLVMALFLLLVPTNVGRRLGTVGGTFGETAGVERDSSVEKRKLLATAALQMFADRPVHGVGAGNFSERYPHYARRIGSSSPQYDKPGATQYPHSLYLEIGAETGLIGLCAFGVALLVAFRTTFRSARLLRVESMSGEALLVSSIALALAGYLVAAMFLHGAYLRYLWIIFAFIVAVARLSDLAAATDGPAEGVRA